MTDLDQPSRFRRVDSLGMIDRMMDMPVHVRDAWALARQVELPRRHAGASDVVICGMGGSAIGGDLVRSLVERECRVPINVVRGYDLPGYVNDRSLVILSSFSGATEETLSACDQALSVGARVVAITAGGELADRARTARLPLVQYSFGGHPREAIGYSTLLILSVLTRLGYVSDRTGEIDETITTLRGIASEMAPDVPSDRNPAKRLAQRIAGKTVLIYGGGLLAEVARRWKGQLNENAKHLAFFEQLPELDHNAILGYPFPRDASRALAVVFLSSSLNHPRILARERITAELAASWGIDVETVTAWGSGALEHILSTTYIGDFVSYYVALVDDVDPSEMEAITHLKRQLTEEAAERSSGTPAVQSAA